jgi:hypothetical protein
MEWLGSSGVRPRQARYQAALRPDMKCFVHSKGERPVLTMCTPTM